MTFYAVFKSTKAFLEETDFVEIYNVRYFDKDYKVIITKQCANRCSVIHCIDNHIAWEQVPLFSKLSGRWYGDKLPIFKFEATDSETVIFVVKGRPNGIVGLDDGIFRCADNFNEKYINVMSYRKFKKLCIK